MTTNTAPQHCSDPSATLALCSLGSCGSSAHAATKTSRSIADKPRPAKIDVAAARCCRTPGSNYESVCGRSTLPNRTFQILNAAASPHFTITPSSLSHPLTSPPFSAKKQYTLKSFLCKTSRCTSNSVGPLPRSFVCKSARCNLNNAGPLPETPSSPVSLYTYAKPRPSQQSVHAKKLPLTPDNCPADSAANGLHSERAGQQQERGGRRSPEPMGYRDPAEYAVGVASRTPLSPPAAFGLPYGLPTPATYATRLTNGHADIAGPGSKLAANLTPSKRSSKERLGLDNLVIPPYEQLQKRRDDFKRKDTSHAPQPPPILAGTPGGKASPHQNHDQRPSSAGEKLTVSAEYLSKHVLNPEFACRYHIGDELGSGGFGFVVSARQLSDGREVAVKFIHKDKVPSHGWIQDLHLGNIPMEIYVIKNFRHPGVIGFIDMFDDPKFFCLVMELHGTPWTSSNPVLQEKKADRVQNSSLLPSATSLPQKNGNMGGLIGAVECDAKAASHEGQDPVDAPCGRQADLQSCNWRNAPDPPPPPRPAMVRRASCDLFECIEHHSKFSENKAKLIFRQVAECVYYLKREGICHRDIKDENIVIDKDLKVKLIDFGSAVLLNPRGRLFDRFYGTINYAAPEILRGEKYRAEAAEVWSLGILLYTLLYGEVPFHDPQQAIHGSYVKPKLQSSPECLHLLNWTLEKNADRRATIGDVFRHPWIAMTPEEMEQARQ